MSIYRKIYETAFGPIPVDKDGRSYEIHHIDGNHKNNDINNLSCITIQEHYDIHYSQADFRACTLIAIRMKLSPAEISALISKQQKSRVVNGTHHFLDKDAARTRAIKHVQHGTHNFQDKDEAKSRNIKRTKDGKNPFTGGMIQKETQQRRVADKTHHFLGGDIAQQSANNRVKNGTHHFLDHPTHVCPYCGKTGKGGVMFRFHFDKCKQYQEMTSDTQSTLAQ